MRQSADQSDRSGGEVRPALSAWLSRGPGALVLAQEIGLASQLITNLFGYHLVLVGSPAYAPVVRASRILHSIIVVPPEVQSPTEPPADECPVSLTARADSLPLNSDCVDVVLLPHVLEFTVNPHDALREAERVLVSEGHLILLGFNPLGAMGLWRSCLRRRGAPWNGQFFSCTRIKDWLALLGFDVLVTQSAFFRPPLQNQRLLDRLGFLEAVGAHMWPYLGATYLILARKRLTTLTPIRPRWRTHRRLVSVGIAEPSPRARAGTSRTVVCPVLPVAGNVRDRDG